MTIRILHVSSHLANEMGGTITAASEIATCTQGDGYECDIAGTIRPNSDSHVFIQQLYPSIQFKDEKSQVFKTTNSFVLPSRYENFGIVVVEAMHHDCPPLITNNVFINEYLNDTNAIYRCESHTDSIAGSILELIQDRDLLHRIAQQCQCTSRKLFEPKVVSNNYRNLYSKTLKTA